MSRQPRRRDKKSAGRILYMSSWPQTNGVLRYRWVPSPRLRALGWNSLDLGTDERAAINAAIARNEELAHWELHRDPKVAAAVPPKPLVRRNATFGDLVHEYRQDMARRASLKRQEEGFLAPKTHRLYNSLLNALMLWAENGATRVRDIDAEMCEDLRQALMAQGSPYTTAARLRMLRTLMGYAVKPLKIITVNPMDDISIKTPKPRTKRAAIDAVEWLADFALTWQGEYANGGPNMALAVLLGFYTTQRECDLLSATRINWRTADDMDDYDRALLAVGGNAPMALRILQSKTQKWVTVFLPPEIAARLDHLIAERGAGWDGNLLLEDTIRAENKGADRQWPEWRFQRDYRAMRSAAEKAAELAGDTWLSNELADLKYSDMRRSGMCWLRDMGVTVPQIATISGHSIAYTTKILDTYLPGDSRGAAAGLASALRTRARRKTALNKRSKTPSKITND